MAYTHKTGAVRFGIQARVLALAVLFTLLTAGIILITSTLSLSYTMHMVTSSACTFLDIALTSEKMKSAGKAPTLS